MDVKIIIKFSSLSLSVANSPKDRREMCKNGVVMLASQKWF